LRPLFPDGNSWTFRIEYVVTYYTFRALLRLKSYCENNHDIVVDTNGIKELELAESNMFQSKLRNCMMHYNLENQNVLSLEHIERPFFGIIENCFDGTDYNSYLKALHSLSARIIDFLEKHFNCSDIELNKL